MGYPQYTHCTKPDDFDPLNRPLAMIGGIGGLLAMIGAIIASAAGGGLLAGALWIAGATGGYLAIVATFEYLLGGKLICLGGDCSAVGTIVGLEPPSSKSFPANLDNDYSFNVLLCPRTPADETLPLGAGPDDELVMATTASDGHHLPFKGYTDYEGRAVLHCEIEGSRIRDTYAAFLAAWSALCLAALIASAVALIPVIGWLLALLAMLLGAAIGAGIVGITWALSADGDPDDLLEEPVSLEVGQSVYVMGTWTYDSGHNEEGEGYNELHPLKHLQLVSGCLKAEERERLDRLVREGARIDAGGGLSAPELQWSFHPEVDGCGRRRPNG
ncbi:MAG: hypothetical protein U0324_00075 [Polyangiales bacterium]